jgi:alkylhydroperoxidase/carboxymuconolactone decarboxylase family protein YurZ
LVGLPKSYKFNQRDLYSSSTLKVNMKDSDLYKQGNAVRRQLLGDERMAELDATAQDPAMQKFMDLSVELIFGGILARPGLDFKTRAFICVVSDVSTGRTAVLPEHVRMAMKEGWTENELTETLLQLVAYVGAPLVRDAIKAIAPTFAELRSHASA